MNASKDEANLQRLALKHRELEERLSLLADRRFLTEPEQLEETNLKKLKLKIKDEMESILVQRPELADRRG